MHIAALFIYPVKSLRGVSVVSAELDALGLVGDRRFMVVDAAGRFLTQRVLPRLALIETALAATELILRTPSGDACVVPRTDPHAPLRRVVVWNDTVEAEDCGEEVAAWLSAFLRQPCRLVRIGPAFHRPVKPSHARPGDVVMFADAFPLMTVSEASLADLNQRLTARSASPVPMDRFRPSLVLGDGAPYAEDRAGRWRAGEVVLRAASPCARCIVTTTDQFTAKRGPEPLRTLAGYRRDATDSTKVNFGQNLIHETKSGTLRVGDAVHPL